MTDLSDVAIRPEVIGYRRPRAQGKPGLRSGGAYCYQCSKHRQLFAATLALRGPPSKFTLVYELAKPFGCNGDILSQIVRLSRH